MNKLPSILTPYPKSQPADHDELNEEISIEEVESAVNANNDNKSPGIDGIKPAFIKN